MHTVSHVAREMFGTVSTGSLTRSDFTTPVLGFFNLSKAQTTLLQFAYFVSYLLVGPPMGFFMRKYGYKIGIHVGLSLFSIGE